jgi:hypothetical protein
MNQIEKIKSEKNEIMSVENVCDTLKNYNLLGNQENILTELLEYNELDATVETVERHRKVLEDLLDQVEKTNIHIKQKQYIKNFLTNYIGLSGNNACLNIIVQETNKLLNEANEEIGHYKTEFQKERDEHNEFRKKYAEKLKDVSIPSFKPTIDLSVTLHDKHKPISSKEIIKLVNQNNNNLNSHRLKRISAKDENGQKISENIKTVHAKKNLNGIQSIHQK